jgi:hypothetical protein
MKVRITLATAALGTAMLGAAACGPFGPSTADMSAEASALTALGFTPDEAVPVGDPMPSASGTAGVAPNGPAKPGRAGHPGMRRLTIRRALARNVEHGELVVKTKDGDKTIDVQRGTITAITSTTVTVKSSDGVSEVWTFGSPIHVVEHRTSVQPSAVTTGETVGVAGTKSGGALTASLLLIASSAG